MALVRLTTAEFLAPAEIEPAWRAVLPARLMIRPNRCSRMNGTTFLATRRMPTNLSSKEERTNSSVTWSKSSATFPLTSAAELTTMSTPPQASATARTIEATEPGSLSWTSTGMSSALSPSPSETIASFARSRLLLQTAVRTPSRASWRTIAMPMPPVPPVTIARLPARARSM